MAGEADEYPLSDGELSFSLWRSNNAAQARVKSPVVPIEEPALDFQSQFASRSDSTSATLADRRGVGISISPNPSSDPAGTHMSSPRSLNSVVSDREFESDFGFAPPSTAHEANLHERFVDRRHLVRTSPGIQSVYLGDENRTHAHPGPEKEEHGSRGSSELSFEDLVDRHEDDLFSSRRNFLATTFRTLMFILIWYLFSTGLTIYNKKLLGAKLWEFPAPLLMNTVHFALQAAISSLALRFFWPSMRPTTSITWRDYFIRVVPTAVATALDIDLTNASLVFITISFETMCKSAAPVFLLLFAFVFKLEAPSFKLFGIISIISSGVLLTGLGSLFGTNAEDQRFEVVGFILVILAAVMSGFRWTVTQVLLQKKEFGLNNPLAVMSQLAPVMAIITAILSIATEPLHNLGKPPFFDTRYNAIWSSFLLLLGGSLAFFMVLAEYLLISRTSAVTLTVAGVVKEVVTILVAVVFLGDDFTAMKGAGLAVIMAGVCWFNWFKYQKFKESKHGDHVEFEKLPVRYVPLTDRSKDGEEMHSF